MTVALHGEQDNQQIIAALERAGHKHILLYNVYREDGEIEVVFRARVREGMAAVGDMEPYIAHLDDKPGAEPRIAAGW